MKTRHITYRPDSRIRSGFRNLIWMWCVVLVFLGGFRVSGLRAQQIQSAEDLLTSFGAGLDGPVRAAVYHNGEWFVGGEFDNASGLPVRRVARWDGAQWRPLLSGVNGVVHALVSFDGVLLVAGSFTEAGSQTVNRIARWDGSTWQAMGTGVNGTVRSIAVLGSEIFIAGDFTMAGTVSAERIARWNGSQWEGLGNGLNGPVHALLAWNGNLVAAGAFSSGGGVNLNRIGIWNGSAWAPLGSGFNGTVNALATDEGKLYAAGGFTESGSASVLGVAVWDGTNWEALGQGLVGNVRSISSHEGDLVAVGEIESSGSIDLQNIAHWDGEQWSNPGGTDTPANVVVVRDDVFYIGGDFMELDGQPAKYFSRAALDAPTTPMPLAPAEGSVNVSTSPIIRWSAARAGFTYQVQVADTEDFSTLVFDGSALDSTEIQVALSQGLTYHYYRIKAFNNIGESDWSEPVRFRTKIMFPMAVSPEHEERGLGSTVTFLWEPVPQAQSYWIEVVNSPIPGSTPILSESGLTQPTFTFTGLSDNVTYYWRLKAENVNSQSDWSPLRQFTVNLPPSTPTLQAPAQGVTQVDTLNVMFRWNVVSNAQFYDLQVSKSEDFINPSLTIEDINALTYTVGQLESNQMYYWRVRSKNVGGASAWSNTRTFRTMAAPPAPVTLLGPADAATNVVISPILTWTLSSRATSYQVQLSTTSSFQPTTIDQMVTGTSFQAKDLVNNRGYYWRVRAINETDVSAWSSINTFTTTAENPPSQVTGLQPANGAVDQPTNFEVSWDPADFAETYRLQVSLSPSFAGVLYDEVTEDTHYLLSGLSPSEQYYWRVAAQNNAGEGTWSATANFKTVVVIPATPSLIAPDSGVVNTPLPVELIWSEVQGAASYELEISTEPLFPPGPSTHLVTSTTPRYEYAAATSTQYFWRVRSVNQAGASDWSEIRGFITVPPVPAKINLISPANEAIDQTIPVQLRWSPTSGVAQYRIQMHTTPDLDQDVIMMDITVTNSFHNVPSLNKGVDYYWRVAGINAGGQGEWSDIRKFQTVPEPPLAPILLSPPSDMEQYINQPMLQWQPQSATNRYHLQLSLSSDFNSQLIIDDPTISGSSFDLRDLTSLPANTIHYWRVMAINSAGTSPWSETRFFRTFPNLPTQPELLNPAHEATMVYMPLAFQWTPTTNAQTYEIMVSETPDFEDETSLPINITGYTDVTLIVESLKSDQQFYWRVRGQNAAGAGPWSNTFAFHTAPQPPGGVTLVSPTNMASNLRRAQTFVWQPVLRADSYELQISESSSFTSLVLQEQNLLDSSFEFFLPKVNTTYYWRVRGRNLSGFGPWSDVFSIQTFAYSAQVDVNFTVQFRNANQSNYQLVALPGRSNLSVAFTFEDAGKQGTDWNAYSERGGTASNPSTLVEIQGNSPENQFIAGRGFWILSRKPWHVDQNFPAVDLAEDETYSIPLRQGWNIIATPFPVSVPWSSVIQANSLNSDQPIWDFLGNWIESAQLQPNKGYYFYNRNNLPSLKIPYPIPTQKVAAATNQIQVAKTTTVDEGLLRLHLYDDESQLGFVQVRLTPEASSGFDEYDHEAPPRTFASAGIALYTDELHPSIHRFNRLASPADGLLEHVVEIEVAQNGFYRILPEVRLPAGWTARLFDPLRGRTFEIGDGQELELQLDKGTRRFKMWLGYADQVASKQQAEVPIEFKLFDAFPNPFNPSTTLDFALPEPASVRLRVYDIMGRLVSTLQQTNLQAGYHSITWNASRMASGMYLIELTAGNNKAVTKVTLLK